MEAAHSRLPSLRALPSRAREGVAAHTRLPSLRAFPSPEPSRRAREGVAIASYARCDSHLMPHQSEPNDPERFWGEMLSADSERIHRAFDRLSADDALSVIAHLERMATEDGWQPEQRERARAALHALEPRPPSTPPEDR